MTESKCPLLCSALWSMTTLRPPGPSLTWCILVPCFYDPVQLSKTCLCFFWISILKTLWKKVVLFLAPSQSKFWDVKDLMTWREILHCLCVFLSCWRWCHSRFMQHYNVEQCHLHYEWYKLQWKMKWKKLHNTKSTLSWVELSSIINKSTAYRLHNKTSSYLWSNLSSEKRQYIKN